MHYQLGCDYGTSLITIYKEGDPVFLCASHAAAIGRPDDNCIAGVRLIEAPSADGDSPPRNDAQPKVQESAAAKQGACVRTTTVGSAARAKVGRESDLSHRRPVRDISYGNSAKALVDETIWNMPPGDYEVYRTELDQGKPALEAAQSAGGQFAVVYRRISEYTRKIEAVLSESKATINVRDVIDKPFEHAVGEIIANLTMSDAEKDRAIDHLGAFQEQINCGLDREMTPLQAHRIARAIGERANWGTGTCLSEELKPAFRAVYNSVRNAIRLTVPEAYELDERLANLYVAKSDLESVSTAKALHTQVLVGSTGPLTGR